MTNIFTEQITEVVMLKEELQTTFVADSPIVMMGSGKMRSEIRNFVTETLRKVEVQIIPLDWVFVTNETFSELFIMFELFSEKFNGSLLLDMMFINFWKEIQR